MSQAVEESLRSDRDSKRLSLDPSHHSNQAFVDAPQVAASTVGLKTDRWNGSAAVADRPAGDVAEPVIAGRFEKRYGSIDHRPEGVDGHSALRIDGVGAAALDFEEGWFDESGVASIAYSASKRAIDIMLSAFSILLISPVWAMVYVALRLQDGGKAIYSHTRVGKAGREFTCYKFRSMCINADKMKSELMDQNSHSDSRTFKLPDDPRVTRLGRFLRMTSLDETPQLINVLLGEMTLVGPRPPVPSEVAQYSLTDMDRLYVKPGLTCIWQVSGRSRIPFPQQLEMDREYIRNRSLWLDFVLIVKTFRAVISRDGAY